MQVRYALINLILNKLTNKHQQFLISVKKSTPEYSIIKVKDIHNFPSINWKVHNINKMTPEQKKISLDKLISCIKA